MKKCCSKGSTLYLKKYLFVEMMVKHQAVQSQFLEVFKICLDVALRDMVLLM